MVFQPAIPLRPQFVENLSTPYKWATLTKVAFRLLIIKGLWRSTNVQIVQEGDGLTRRRLFCLTVKHRKSARRVSQALAAPRYVLQNSGICRREDTPFHTRRLYLLGCFVLLRKCDLLNSIQKVSFSDNHTRGIFIWCL